MQCSFAGIVLRSTRLEKATLQEEKTVSFVYITLTRTIGRRDRTVISSPKIDRPVLYFFIYIVSVLGLDHHSKRSSRFGETLSYAILTTTSPKNNIHRGFSMTVVRHSSPRVLIFSQRFPLFLDIRKKRI